jgi:ABC-type nitrate/sulfonate/bicarbonate transport system substrate-binding protein
MLGRLLLAAGLALAVPVAASAQDDLVELNAGMVSSIDQLGLPIALEQGFFEKHGLDVTIANPFATGVDSLNALQAGTVDVVQVGVPMIGAVLRGMDLVALGNFSGSAAQLGSDTTMALVAREGSGISGDDLSSLKGKRIAASFGTINHLYVLALIEAAGLGLNEVELVNTPPPDMTVALLSGGIDAFVGWDPWPIVGQRTVPGAYEVVRGGNHISYLGFNVALRDWAEENGETLEHFLAALSEADQWMRQNPSDAAQVATRWIPGLDPEVAEEAMQYNIQQSDRRLSANNYAALHAAVTTLNRLGFIDATFDVNEHVDPRPILAVMDAHPELFSDLPPIPAEAQIGEDFSFQP